MRQIVVYKWRKFNTGVTVPRSGRPAKMLHIWRSEKSTWMPLAKYTLDRLTKVELFGKKNTQCYVWWKKAQYRVHQHQNLITTVKYGRQAIMIWRHFVASGLGLLVTIGWNMSSQVQQDILEESVRPIEAQQKLGDATGKQCKAQKWINNRMSSTEENMPY